MINARRDLRTGTTLWDAHAVRSFPTRSSPSRDFWDAVVIGAGISGCMAAEAIARPGLSVLVVDRRPPASGSTAASTALVQWEIDLPLGKLGAKVGARKANACYRASFAAVQKLKRRIGELGIDCETAPRETLLIAGNAMGATALKREALRRKTIGLPSRFLSGSEVEASYGFDRDGAILSTGGLECDPRKLALGMAAAARRSGAEFVSPATVENIHATAAGVFLELALASGPRLTIAARKVVAATGYETLPAIPADKYRLISTWALATVRQRPDSFWRRRALVWEASDPYLYFRATADNRIVVGGEDAAFDDPARRDARIAAKTRRILEKFGTLVPEARLEADFAWAGTFAESPTGLPAIGPVRDRPNVFAILGSGGNGITYSAIAADLARAWVQGKPHRLAPLFRL